MIHIAKEAKENPDLVKSAPITTPVRRLDDVKAAREPDVCWGKTKAGKKVYMIVSPHGRKNEQAQDY
jgi:glycine cleavage system protein P-like pyridoxal-binding family